jgi:adenosylmethionine---8-amino-7-oxononanoate aminotransferase
LNRSNYRIWHPYTQEKLSERPFLVKSAEKEFLHILDADGNPQKIIDGISSWWVNIHGHSHPFINEALKQQIDKLEHVIFSGFTHEPAIQLVDGLLDLLPKIDSSSTKSRTLSKAFFSDNGSTAVEVAIKMAIQYFYNEGQKRKKRIVALKDAYHGDTVGCMSASDTPVFHQAFKSILFPVHFISSPAAKVTKKIKYSEQVKLEAQEEAEEKSFEDLYNLLSLYPNEFAAVIVEPLVQGAGGMKFYGVNFLKKLRKLCDNEKIFLIADEVFTGFGRTGEDFACSKALIVPDIICLSKALTGGYLPLGLSICTEEIYSAFYSDSRLKTFFHGHSFTANPLACTAALASLQVYKKENRLNDVKYLNLRYKRDLLESDLIENSLIEDIRIMGAIAVIEFKNQGSEREAYLNEIGPLLYKAFLERNILLRPLGNTLYFLPPYTISVDSLDYCLKTIKEVSRSLEKSLCS